MKKLIDLQYFSLETTGIQLNCKYTSDLILYSDSHYSVTQQRKAWATTGDPVLRRKTLSTSLHFSDSLLWYSADLQPPTVSTAHNSGSDSLAQVQTGHLSLSHLHFQPMSLCMNIYLVHISLAYRNVSRNLLVKKGVLVLSFSKKRQRAQRCSFFPVKNRTDTGRHVPLWGSTSHQCQCPNQNMKTMSRDA